MTGGYAICLNEWIFDTTIKCELNLLLYISSLTAEKGYCFASNQYFAEKFNTNEVNISRKIKKLEEKGYITIEYTKRGCEIIDRKIRLTKMLTDDYQKCQPTINKNVKDNNTIINNANNNIKKENIKEKKQLDLSFCNSQFLELINKWLKYKKEKKQSYTQMGIEMFYKKLLTLSNNNLSVASEIINNSIANNYAGIFELKNNKSSNYNYCSQQDCPY